MGKGTTSLAKVNGSGCLKITAGQLATRIEETSSTEKTIHYKDGMTIKITIPSGTLQIVEEEAIGI